MEFERESYIRYRYIFFFLVLVYDVIGKWDEGKIVS